MRKFENNFTTIEQSERLLALGLPVDTADCYYEMAYRPTLQLLPEGISFSQLPQYIDDEDGDADGIPCWSVGRLMEIYKLCCDADRFFECVPFGLTGVNLCELMVMSFENVMETVGMDYTKLED